MGAPKIKPSHRENAKKLREYAEKLFDAIASGGDVRRVGRPSVGVRDVMVVSSDVCRRKKLYNPAKLFDRVLFRLGWDPLEPADVELCAMIVGRHDMWTTYVPDPGPQRGKTKPKRD